MQSTRPKEKKQTLKKSSSSSSTTSTSTSASTSSPALFDFDQVSIFDRDDQNYIDENVLYKQISALEKSTNVQLYPSENKMNNHRAKLLSVYYSNGHFICPRKEGEEFQLHRNLLMHIPTLIAQILLGAERDPRVIHEIEQFKKLVNASYGKTQTNTMWSKVFQRLYNLMDDQVRFILNKENPTELVKGFIRFLEEAYAYSVWLSEWHYHLSIAYVSYLLYKDEIYNQQWIQNRMVATPEDCPKHACNYRLQELLGPKNFCFKWKAEINRAPTVITIGPLLHLLIDVMNHFLSHHGHRLQMDLQCKNEYYETIQESAVAVMFKTTENDDENVPDPYQRKLMMIRNSIRKEVAKCRELLKKDADFCEMFKSLVLKEK